MCAPTLFKRKTVAVFASYGDLQDVSAYAYNEKHNESNKILETSNLDKGVDNNEW